MLLLLLSYVDTSDNEKSFFILLLSPSKSHQLFPGTTPFNIHTLLELELSIFLTHGIGSVFDVKVNHDADLFW